MDSEDPADHVFVDIETEGQADLLGNALATPRAIAAFHFNNRVNQLLLVLLDLAVGSVRLKTAAGTLALLASCENATVSPASSDGGAQNASRTHQQGAQTPDNPI